MENQQFKKLIKEALTPDFLKEDTMPSQGEVNSFFEHSFDDLHYLNSKPVGEWDEYDLSNWESKKRKRMNESVDEEVVMYNGEEHEIMKQDWDRVYIRRKAPSAKLGKLDAFWVKPEDIEESVNEDKKAVDSYIKKWNDKMKGSSRSTAKDWVDGIKGISKEDKESILKGIKESVNEAKEKKLNKDLGNIDGTFGEDNFDKEDAEVYDVKPGKYIKFYIEDESNSSILKVKRIAKENGLKFVKDLDDMLLFKESVNESKYRVEYTTQDGEKAKSRVYNSEEEAEKKEKQLVDTSGIKQAKIVKVEESVNEAFDPEGDYDIQYEIGDYERGDEVVVLPSLSHDPLDKQGETGKVFDITEPEYIKVKFDDGQIGEYLVGQVVFPGDENYRHREDEWSVNA